MATCLRVTIILYLIDVSRNIIVESLCETCITSIKVNQNGEVLVRPSVIEADHENKIDICLFRELYLKWCSAVRCRRPVIGREVIENRVLEFGFKCP